MYLRVWGMHEMRAVPWSFSFGLLRYIQPEGPIGLPNDKKEQAWFEQKGPKSDLAQKFYLPCDKWQRETLCFYCVISGRRSHLS